MKQQIVAVFLSLCFVSQCSYSKQLQCQLPNYHNLMIKQDRVCSIEALNRPEPRPSKTSIDQLDKEGETLPDVKRQVDVHRQVRLAKERLFRWLKEMKDVWKDFPILDGSDDGSDPVKFFGDCRIDPVTDFDGIFNVGEKSRSCFSEFGVTKLNGSFVGGNLNGFATVHFANGSFIRAPFANGSISGLFRRFTCLYGSCDFDYEPWNAPDRLAEVELKLSRHCLDN